MATEERHSEEAPARPAPAAEPTPAPPPGMGLSPSAASVVGLSRSAGNAAVAGLASGSATPPPNLAVLGALARATRYGSAGAGGLSGMRGAVPAETAAESAAHDANDADASAGAPATRRPDALAGGFAQALQRRSLARREETGADMVDIEMTKRISRASDEELLEMLRKEPLDFIEMSQVWRRFGDRSLDIARQNPDVFEKSIKVIPGIAHSTGLRKAEDAFKADVLEIVRGILKTNSAYVQSEMDRVGAYAEGQAPGQPTPEQDAQLREMQKMAAQLARAKDAMTRLKTIPVGYDWDVQDTTGGGQKAEKYLTTYDPATKPHMRDPEMKTWEEVDAQYRPVNAIWLDFQARSPTMLALAESGGDPAAVAGAEPADARAQVGKLLQGLQAKIAEATGKVGDDLEYFEFVPIHGQLFAGTLKGGSGFDWTKSVEQTLAKQYVEGHTTAELMRSLGISILAAAAFILAELATGGMATFLLAGTGIGLGAGQAAMSWDKYNDLASARAASIKPEMALVSKEQVDSALLSALLDTVFVFLDGAGVVVGGGRSAKAAAGLVAAAEKGLAESGYLALKEANAGGKAIVERAVSELGARETMQRAGKSADQLIEIVGKESEAATKLRAATELGEAGAKKATEDAIAGLAKLGELAAKGEKVEVQRIVLMAFDQFGYAGTIKRAGGWKALTAAIGKESSLAGDMLMRWRDGLMRDLEAFIARETAEQGQVVRTGTKTNVTNDMDMSMFGDMAAQNGEKAKQFLAGRAGVGADELDHVLNAEVFVDPSRMHLQDVAKGLPDDVRREISREAARYEEQMVFGRRLYEAVDDEAKLAVRKEAEALGITPWENYKPASPADIATKQKQIDGWISDLEKATDSKTKKDLIDKVGKNQGEILAAGEGGYATGGGVRVNVTDRPIDADRMPIKTQTPLYPEQRYTAILAEGPHLDRAVAALGKPGAKAEDAVQALRNIGKHGERVTQLVGGDVAPLAAGKGESLGNRLAQLAEDAKTGRAAARLAGDADALRAEVAAYLKQLKEASAKATKTLRDEAQLGKALTPEQMSQLQFWSEVDTKITRYADAIDGELPAIIEGLKATAHAAMEEESQQSLPPADSSQTPAPAPTPAPVARRVARAARSRGAEPADDDLAAGFGAALRRRALAREGRRPTPDVDESPAPGLLAAHLARAALLRAPPPTKPAGASVAERVEKIWKAFHDSSWTEDEEGALAQLSGQSAGVVRDIASAYYEAHRVKLVDEFRRYCSAAQFTDAMVWLHPTLSLDDRIRSADGNAKVILQEVERTTPDERTLAWGDLHLRDYLTNTVTDNRQLYKIRKLLAPKELREHVVYFLQHARGAFDDDEGGAANVVLDLDPAARATLWSDNEKRVWGKDLFEFMGAGEKDQMRVVCTGSEAEALTQAMALSTEGAGTDDESVKELVAKAKAAMEKDPSLREKLAAKGTDGKLSFLEMIHDDVSAGELQSFMTDLGSDQVARAKQRILDALGAWDEDEDVYKAFDSLVGKAELPKGADKLSPDERQKLQDQADQKLKKTLWDDSEVQAALKAHMSQEEINKAQTFATGDHYAIALMKLSDAYHGVDTDEEAILKIICGLPPGSRAKLDGEQIYKLIYSNFDADERKLLEAAVKDGKVPTEAAIKWATEGLGTEDEMIEQTFAAMSQKERDDYRLGYFLWKGHTVPNADPKEATRYEEAKKKFATLYEQLDDDMDGDDLIKALDRLLGKGSFEDAFDPAGRFVAVTIMHDRIVEKEEQRRSVRGVVSSGIVDTFSESGEAQDRAYARFMSAYEAAMSDKVISGDEYAVLVALDDDFSKARDEHVAAVESIAQVASTVAAIAAAIAVSFLTGGAGAPGAAALLAKAGAAGLAGAVAKVGTDAVVQGEHMSGEEAVKDALTGFVEGASAVLAAGLTARFATSIGLSGEALAASLAQSVLTGAEGVAAQAGKTVAVGALRAGIEGLLSGMIGELVVTASDEALWKKGVLEVIESFGAAIVRGGLIGAATGVVTGGILETIAVYRGAAAARALAAHLGELGYPAEKVTTDLARAVALADAALAGKGDPAKRAADAMTQMKASGVADDEAERIWRSLAKRNGVDDPGPWAKEPAKEGEGGTGGEKKADAEGKTDAESEQAKKEAEAKAKAEADQKKLEQMKQAANDWKGKHPGNEFEPVGDMLRVNKQIDVHPDALSSLEADGKLGDLLNASKALDAVGGDPSKLDDAGKKLLNAVSGSKGLRFRFRFQLDAEVDEFLRRMGLDGNDMFKPPQLTDAGRARIFEYLNDLPKVMGKRPAIEQGYRQANNWALKGAKDAREFVDRAELYWAILDREIDKIAAEFEDKLLDALAKAGKTKKDPEYAAIRKKLSQDYYGKEATTNDQVRDFADEKAVAAAAKAGDPNAPSDAMMKQLDELYAKNAAALAGKLDGVSLAPELSNADLVKQVQDLPNVPFSRESAGAYHPEKHPPSDFADPWPTGLPKTGDNVTDYIALAHHAIKNGTPTVKIAQDGSRSIHFTMGTGDDAYTAIVHVGRDGKASLATLF